MIENEKKFLFREDLFPVKFSSVPKDKIEQGYVMMDRNKELRVRIYNNSDGEMTLKIRSNPETCIEITSHVDIDDCIELWKHSEMRLVKYRVYCEEYQTREYSIVIDSYRHGLKIVEVEFPTGKKDAAIEYIKTLPWIGEEITGVEKYSNVYIARNKLST